MHVNNSMLKGGADLPNRDSSYGGAVEAQHFGMDGGNGLLPHHEACVHPIPAHTHQTCTMWKQS